MHIFGRKRMVNQNWNRCGIMGLNLMTAPSDKFNKGGGKWVQVKQIFPLFPFPLFCILVVSESPCVTKTFNAQHTSVSCPEND